MSPLRTHVSFSRRGGPVAVATLVAALVCAAVLAACGGSSGGASPSADAADSSVVPVPAPQVTSGPPPAAAVAVVEEFWTLLGEGRLREAQRTLVAPGSPILQWGDPGIASARFVDVAPGSVDPRPEPDATVQFLVTVWIEGADGATPWGEPSEHDLYQRLVRMTDGSWKMWDSATGP